MRGDNQNILIISFVVVSIILLIFLIIGVVIISNKNKCNPECKSFEKCDSNLKCVDITTDENCGKIGRACKDDEFCNDDLRCQRYSITKCGSDAECKGISAGFCNLNTGKCVECLRDRDCINGDCEDYKCINECEPNCENKVCGNDGCNGSCGECASGFCNSSGKCVANSFCLDNCSSLNFECGMQNICGKSVNCTNIIGGCNDNEVCNSTGQCVSEEDCNETCSSLGFECGMQNICGKSVNCTNIIGGCNDNEVCNPTGQCVDETITCVDTDGGKMFNVSGVTYLNIINKKNDFCKTQYLLQEWYCDNNKLVNQTYNCNIGGIGSCLINKCVCPDNYHWNGTRCRPNLVTGINYLSKSNWWGEDIDTLDKDFERFANDGIKHLSFRIMWNYLEPEKYEGDINLNPVPLNNFKRALNEADKYDIKVNVDFWSQHNGKLGLPTWVGTYWDIETDPEIQDHYVRYMQAVVKELKDYPAVESWSVLNEPYFGTASNGEYAGKEKFQETFPILYNAIKSVDSARPVICRFTLSFTPASGKFDESVYDMFDIFTITEYLDPSNMSDIKYNSKWEYFDKTISDLKARDKKLWVIEFGDNNPDQEHVRLHYEKSLQKFIGDGIVDRAYAWAWRTRDFERESYNLYNGTAPKLAYYELKL